MLSRHGQAFVSLVSSYKNILLYINNVSANSASTNSAVALMAARVRFPFRDPLLIPSLFPSLHCPLAIKSLEVAPKVNSVTLLGHAVTKVKTCG